MPKQIKGIWLPDNERYLVSYIERDPEFAGKGTHQFHKLQAALQHVTHFRHAVDIGAHVGLMAYPLTRYFNRVTCFEPASLVIECLRMNLADVKNCDVTIHQYALGDHERLASLSFKELSSAMSHIDGHGHPTETVVVQTLDSFNLQDVDFIKIDTEGFEKFVVAGGEQTIKRCKPCIMLEQKPNNAERYGAGQLDATYLLKSWGARQVWNLGDDRCLCWKV